MIHLDTLYLIDLMRETTRDKPGPAVEFIEGLDPPKRWPPRSTSCAELRAGAELSRSPLKEHEELDRLLSGLVVAYQPMAETHRPYGRLLAAVQRSSRPIAAMDLLIATAAIIDDAPLVTRNVKDFSRVPGLRVLGY